MRVISILYHDIVNREDFRSNDAARCRRTRYNIERDELANHFAAIAEARSRGSGSAVNIIGAWSGPLPLLLTFDDGNLSAYTSAANLLESRGWRGHFFIPTKYIGTSGFVSKEQIRELRERGHFIGSHSWSHPDRMSHCGWKQLTEEWNRSVNTLGDILGEPITLASVPGGHYSRKVAEAASVAGIKALFNSEPVTKCRYVHGCMVLGRYTILRGMPPIVVAKLASDDLGLRFKHLLFWNLKKTIRWLGGESYVRLRRRIVEHEYRERRIESPGPILSRDE